MHGLAMFMGRSEEREARRDALKRNLKATIMVSIASKMARRRRRLVFET